MNTDMSVRGLRPRGPLALRATAGLLASISLLAATPVLAQDGDVLQRLEALEAAFQERFDALEAENRALRAEVETLRQAAVATQPAVHTSAAVAAAGPVDVVVETDDPREMQVAGSENFVGTNGSYAYRMLDHAENVNTKPLVQLAALQSGELPDRVTLSGQVTAIMNYQWSDTENKFGYLMRHPTAANQLGGHVSEAVLHSASLAMTARLTPSLTGYAEFLYDPEQSFGAGTITALDRNQVQLRRGWVMFGNLDRLPVYALLGKMDVPFGLNETVSPFTNSTNWHAFAGLAYGAQAGLHTGGLDLRAMAVQGGSQFRAANSPVLGSSTPSRVNNFAFDARYTLSLGGADSIMVGASYLDGTAYCQGYPVVHFNPCQDNNPGVAAYGRIRYGDLTLLGEYARTTHAWPGTQVPDPTNPLSIYDAVDARAFTIGGRYGFGAETVSTQQREFALSAEYSRFVSGDEGAPWQRQNQVVLGTSWFVVPNVNLFAEFTHVDGYVPLNFLSGGNLPNGATHSVDDANTNVVLAGAQVAF